MEDIEIRGCPGLDVLSACQMDELQVSVRDMISKIRREKKEDQKDGWGIRCLLCKCED